MPSAAVPASSTELRAAGADPAYSCPRREHDRRQRAAPAHGRDDADRARRERSVERRDPDCAARSGGEADGEGVRVELPRDRRRRPQQDEPASCDTITTGASRSRRVKTPPRKSAVPQTTLEVRASATATTPRCSHAGAPGRRC
jgi:hypothetical protein